MKHRFGVSDPTPAPLAGASRRFTRATPTLRVALVLLTLLWTQLPLGGGARAEGGRALELCCAWGRTLGDGELTWSVSSDDGPTADVIRAAVREWDDALPVTLTERDPGAKGVDIAIAFAEAAGRTEGQAVTSFTRRGLIRRVEVAIQGGRAPENTGGLIQIAKHEFGHALGLGHANHDGNLMSEAVSPEPSPIPTCAVQGVVEANRWKMVDPPAKRPQRPQATEVAC